MARQGVNFHNQPNENTKSLSRNMICYRCNQEGHLSRDCREPPGVHSTRRAGFSTCIKKISGGFNPLGSRIAKKQQNFKTSKLLYFLLKMFGFSLFWLAGGCSFFVHRFGWQFETSWVARSDFFGEIDEFSCCCHIATFDCLLSESGAKIWCSKYWNRSLKTWS